MQELGGSAPKHNKLDCRVRGHDPRPLTHYTPNTYPSVDDTTNLLCTGKSSAYVLLALFSSPILQAFDGWRPFLWQLRGNRARSNVIPDLLEHVRLSHTLSLFQHLLKVRDIERVRLRHMPRTKMEMFL